MSATYAYVGGEPPEWQLRKQAEDKYGPIPAGLKPKEVLDVAFKAGYGGFRGLASYGTYPPPKPVEPEYTAEQAAYLAKVAAAEEKARKKREADARRKQREERLEAKAWWESRPNIILEGNATLIDHDYGAWDLKIGRRYLMKDILGEHGAFLENTPAGKVRVTIEFLP